MSTGTIAARVSGLGRARVAVSLAFLVNGFVLSMWVVNIPAVAEAAGVGNEVLGTTLLVLGGGSVIGMQTAGLIAARIGSRATVALGVLLLTAGVALLGAIADVPGLAIALSVLGLGNGVIDVAMNDQAVVVQRGYGRPIMSAFHALFSVGGMIGAGLGALLQAIGVGRTVAFLIAAGVAVALGTGSVLGLLSREDNASAVEQSIGQPSSDRPVLRRAIVLGALAFAFFLAEGMVNDWSALHAVQHLHEPAPVASTAYLVFAITMAAGRLLIDRVVATIGAVAVVRLGSGVAVLGLAIVILSTAFPLTLTGWTLLAVGLSGIVPQLFTAAGNLTTGPSATILLSRIVSAGYFGMLAGPAIIGWISTSVGINLALLLPLTLILLGLIAAPVVTQRRSSSAPTGLTG